MSGEVETERAQLVATVQLAAAAQAALGNAAIMAYFDGAERNMIETLLVTENRDEVERLRVAANLIRKLKQFLREGVEEGDYAAKLLERINKEEQAR